VHVVTDFEEFMGGTVSGYGSLRCQIHLIVPNTPGSLLLVMLNHSILDKYGNRKSFFSRCEFAALILVKEVLSEKT
jgi:hypothetical protein